MLLCQVITGYFQLMFDKRIELRAINNVKDVLLHVMPFKCVECHSNVYFTYMDIGYLLKNHR